MDQLAGYLLLACCVVVHVTVLLRVIAGLRARRRIAGSPGPDPLLSRVVMPSGTRN